MPTNAHAHEAPPVDGDAPKCLAVTIATARELSDLGNTMIWGAHQEWHA